MEHWAKCSYCGHKEQIDVTLVGGKADCESCGQTFPVPLTNISAGLVQDNYWVQSAIGNGNASQTFVAKLTVSETKMYLKVLARSLTQDEETINSYLRPIGAWQCPEIPRILTAEDMGTMLDHYYIASTYAEGTFVDQLIGNRGPLDEERTLEISRQVAELLNEAAQTYGLVHGNIRPSNIMVDVKNHVYLLDGGADRRLLVMDWSAANHKGDVISYMSPEQLAGNEALDFRTDMYALGASMCYLLTGEAPFAGDPLAVQAEILQGKRPDLSAVEDLSPMTRDLIEQLMHADPAARPRSWDDVIARLEVPKGVEKTNKGRTTQTSVLGVDPGDLTRGSSLPKWFPYALGGAILTALLLAAIAMVVAMRSMDSSGTPQNGIRRFDSSAFARRLEAYRARAKKDPKQAVQMVGKIEEWLTQTDDPEQIKELKAFREFLKTVVPKQAGLFREERTRPPKPHTRPAFGTVPTPAAYWTFDKVEKGMTFDVGKKAVHADVPDGIVFASGWKGRAIVLNLQDKTLLLRQGDRLAAGPRFTWTAWVRGLAGKRPDGPIVAHLSSRREWKKGAKALGFDSGALVFKVFGGATVRYAGVPENGWFQVGVTVDLGRVRLYVNGKLVKEQSFDKKLFACSRFRGVLGRCPQFATGAERFVGVLDELKRFTKELSPEQMQAMYNQDRWFSLWGDPKLVAFWPLDEPNEKGLWDAGPHMFDLSAWDPTKAKELGSRPANRFRAGEEGADLLVAKVGNATLDSAQHGSCTIILKYQPFSAPDGVRPAKTAAQFLIGKRAWPDARRPIGAIPKRFKTSQHLGILFNGDRKISFEWAGAGKEYRIKTDVAFPVNEECFVAVRLDEASKQVMLTVNGEHTVSRKLTTWHLARKYREREWQIGAYCPRAARWQYPADGVISDVWIFDRVLSDGETEAIRAGTFD